MNSVYELLNLKTLNAAHPKIDILLSLTPITFEETMKIIPLIVFLCSLFAFQLMAQETTEPAKELTKKERTKKQNIHDDLCSEYSIEQRQGLKEFLQFF